MSKYRNYFIGKKRNCSNNLWYLSDTARRDHKEQPVVDETENKKLFCQLFLSAASGRGIAAVAGWRAAGHHAVDDSGSAAHAGVDGDRTELAVHGAGPAFHAQVLVRDRRALVLHLEDTLRADLDTPAAAGAPVP